MTKAEAIALEEYRRAHVPLYNDQKLKLGVFGPQRQAGSQRGPEIEEGSARALVFRRPRSEPGGDRWDVAK